MSDMGHDHFDDFPHALHNLGALQMPIAAEGMGRKWETKRSCTSRLILDVNSCEKNKPVPMTYLNLRFHFLEHPEQVRETESEQVSLPIVSVDILPNSYTRRREPDK